MAATNGSQHAWDEARRAVEDGAAPELEPSPDLLAALRQQQRPAAPPPAPEPHDDAPPEDFDNEGPGGDVDLESLPF